MATEKDKIATLNEMPPELLRESFFKCSGSKPWTESMLSARPFADRQSLRAKSAQSWVALSKSDWLEAFKIHPRIGDLESLKKKYASTASWASNEQSGTNEASEEILKSLSSGNANYEKRFGYIFIVCATGKSAAEMLAVLNTRLANDPVDEFSIACEEQKKITDLRLDKLF